jgi:hypothetical protein
VSASGRTTPIVGGLTVPGRQESSFKVSLNFDASPKNSSCSTLDWASSRRTVFLEASVQSRGGTKAPNRGLIFE